MIKPPRPQSRRSEALSKARIVAAAIAVLDEAGEDALTFRVLTARLSTGFGALYHHVGSKDELLRAAAGQVIDEAAAHVAPEAAPDEAVRELALAVFDAIDAHPWAGAQLAREPWQAALLQLFRGIEERLASLGVPGGSRFAAASVLVHYILGVAGQYTAGARAQLAEGNRTAFLAKVTSDWARAQGQADQAAALGIAAQLTEHDDREQFQAGIDIILAGISALSLPPRTPTSRNGN
jgi:AcrR family transcriptional regulator